MAELLAQKDSYKQIEYIVHRARKFVVIISPFVDFSSLLDLVRKRNTEQVLVVIIVYKNKPFKPNDYDVIENIMHMHNVKSYILDRPEGVFDKRFHCKCYFNESRFLVSSMNLTWKKNRCPDYNYEYSVLLYKLKDMKLYYDALNWYCDFFAKKIIGQKYTIESLFNHDELGHCSRCGVSIERDLRYHYCRDCFERYIKYGNDRKLNYCHFCGVSLNGNNKVICNNCYNEYIRGISN